MPSKVAVLVTDAGAASRPTVVLMVMVPVTPCGTEKFVHVQVSSTWLVPQPFGVRVNDVGGGKFEGELPLTGRPGWPGSTRSSVGGRQSVTTGLTSTPAERGVDADTELPASPCRPEPRPAAR